LPANTSDSGDALVGPFTAPDNLLLICSGVSLVYLMRSSVLADIEQAHESPSEFRMQNSEFRMRNAEPEVRHRLHSEFGILNYTSP
jgi:hypothetical protein